MRPAMLECESHGNHSINNSMDCHTSIMAGRHQHTTTTITTITNHNDQYSHDIGCCIEDEATLTSPTTTANSTIMRHTKSNRRTRPILSTARTNNSTAMSLFALLLLLTTASTLLPSAHADDTTTTNDDDAGTLCSCSPLQFTFRLILSASCPRLPPPYPPNSVFGAGVKDYTCTIGAEPIDEASNDIAEIVEGVVTRSGGDAAGDDVNDDEDEMVRRGLQAGTGSSTTTTTIIDLQENQPDDHNDDIASFEKLVESAFNSGPTSGITDYQPIIIDSIQFIEVDPQFNVINQDPTYVSGVEFVDGDLFSYTSIVSSSSSTTDERGAIKFTDDFVDGDGVLSGGAPTSGGDSSSSSSTVVVPGGISMVLRGKNKDGDRIRNVFTITYTNDCNVETFRVGDAIGWVEFDDFVPASDSTCDASEPTPSPTTYGNTPIEPTFSLDYLFSKSGKHGKSSQVSSKSNKVGKNSKQGGNHLSSTASSSSSKSSKAAINSTDNGHDYYDEPLRRKLRTSPEQVLKGLDLDQDMQTMIAMHSTAGHDHKSMTLKRKMELDGLKRHRRNLR